MVKRSLLALMLIERGWIIVDGLSYSLVGPAATRHCVVIITLQPAHCSLELLPKASTPFSPALETNLPAASPRPILSLKHQYITSPLLDSTASTSTLTHSSGSLHPHPHSHPHLFPALPPFSKLRHPHISRSAAYLQHNRPSLSRSRTPPLFVAKG